MRFLPLLCLTTVLAIPQTSAAYTTTDDIVTDPSVLPSTGCYSPELLGALVFTSPLLTIHTYDLGEQPMYHVALAYGYGSYLIRSDDTQHPPHRGILLQMNGRFLTIIPTDPQTSLPLCLQ